MKSDSLPILLIGYGNTGRGDDGLGPGLAGAIERRGIPFVKVSIDFQLQLDHAVPIALSRATILVDACRTGAAPFFFRRMTDSAREIPFTSHCVTPRALSFLCEKLFNVKPPVFILGIRGYEFEIGDRFTRRAESNLASAVVFMRRLLDSYEARLFS